MGSRKAGKTSSLSRSSRSKAGSTAGFSPTDFIIMRILGSITKATVETYENVMKSVEKVVLRKNILTFVREIYVKKTVKDTIRLIKTQVPALFGYT
jgi:hypothetical protein